MTLGELIVSKYLIVLIAVVVAVSAGCIFFLTNEGGPSFKVVYCVDGIPISEQSCGNSAIMEDIDPSYCTNDTFFGWNVSADWDGTTYMPGDKISVNGETILYAILVDGLINTDARGNVYFTLDNNDVHDEVLLDLRSLDVVESVTICEDSLEAIKNSGRSISLMYPDGMCLTIDGNTISKCSSGSLSIRINEVDHGRDVELISGSSSISKISGSLGFDIPLGNDIPKGAIFFLATDIGGHEIETKFNDNKVSFTIGALGFRYVSLVKVMVIDVNGSQIQSDDENYPNITSSESKYFERWHMFEKGDRFTISAPETGTYYNMSGAIKKVDRSYEVIVDTKLIISIAVGNEKHNIILPEDQLGYTMTADYLQVEDNGRVVITYKLKSGYVDEDLIINVNDNAMELDGMSRVFINNIFSDIVVEVSGVYDVREYSIELPSEQKGFTITSSEEKVHHGLSYELKFTILPDFERGVDFALLINGKELNLLSGIITIKNVMALQHIEVKGVQLQSFDVTAGAHTKLKVNGVEVTNVTCRDVITVHPDDGYILPSSFVSNLMVTIHECKGGYKVTGTSEFPSVVKITTGDNVFVNGQKSTYLCTGDRVIVSTTSGYRLPDDYCSTLSGLGVTIEKGNYSFGKDANLPSIYKAEYYCVEKKVDTIFYSYGSNVVESKVIPNRTGYTFDKWNLPVMPITDNVYVLSKWIANVYTLSIGKNVNYSINKNTSVCGPSTINVTIEDDVNLHSELGYDIPKSYLLSMQKDGNIYHLKNDVTIPSLYNITYCYEGKIRVYTYVENSIIGIMRVDTPDVLDSLFINCDVTKFMYWEYEDKKIEGTITVQHDYLLTPKWRT